MRSNAQRVARPAQTRLQNSEVTGPQFTKFLSDVEGPSMVLTFASMIHVAIHPIRCGMPAHRMKVGHANFRRLAPKIGYHSNFPLAIAGR